MNATFTPSLFLENLRAATAQSHKNLEALPVSESIMKPDVSKKDYILYLKLMHDMVKDAEENIFPRLYVIITDLEDRNKLPLLEADLEFLGHSTKNEERPLSHTLPKNSNAFALGILYVLEGSSLGGRVILKNITKALGYDSVKGARYFTGYGTETGSHWKNFLDMLQQYEAEHNCGNEIMEGANYAFNAISRHFVTNNPE